MSDDPHFRFTGFVNKQNYCYRAENNRPGIHQTSLHRKKVIGPFLYDSDDSGESNCKYCELLCHAMCNLCNAMCNFLLNGLHIEPMTFRCIKDVGFFSKMELPLTLPLTACWHYENVPRAPYVTAWWHELARQVLDLTATDCFVCGYQKRLWDTTSQHSWVEGRP